MKKTAALTALALSLVFVLSACIGFGGIDELYSLPRPQEEFLQLQELIDEEIASGCEYSAPTDGTQRQSVQLFDIDGDGSQEALAFLRRSEEAPKVCIYRKTGASYELACTINGEGTGVGRVEYADIDGDGVLELMVSWIMSPDLKLVKVYSLKDWTTAVMLSQNCTDFLVGDMNSDGRSDVSVLCFDSEGGRVSVFTADRAGEIAQMSENVSVSLKTADRFRIASLGDGTPAVFVEGHYDSGETGVLYLTDVFVLNGDRLRSVLRNEETMDSGAVRPYAVYSYDINSDGALEIPFAEQVYTQPGVTAQYFVFDWYGYDAAGAATKTLSTYHCYNDGWYIVLPDEWREGLTVRRKSDSSGERAVTLSVVDPQGGLRDILTIFTLTDENRAEKAAMIGRFILLQNDTTIYAARYDSISSDHVTDENRQLVIDSFNLIYSEWNTGAV